MKKGISLILVLQMLAPLSSYSASTPVASAPVVATAPSAAAFGNVLKTYRSQLDQNHNGVSQEAILRDFAQGLIDKNVGVEDVDAYVKSKLTTSEYANFKKFLDTSLKGIDPNKLTAEEYSGVISEALKQTQAKGLTWSGCTTLSIGILVAVASVVVGIVAIAKHKLDAITSQGLYNDYVSRQNSINSTYSDTTAKLNDPKGYFGSKINGTNVAISNRQSDIYSYQGSIANDRAEISKYQYYLDFYDLTDSERASYRSYISSDESDINYYYNKISSAQSDISSYYTNISYYQAEINRYQDPNTIKTERAALEAWLPKSLADAKSAYEVNLKNMPANNDSIAAKNVQIASTKKTLGIIAGVGGAASLAAILSSTNQGCYQ